MKHQKSEGTTTRPWNLLMDFQSLTYRKQGRETLTQLTPEAADEILKELFRRARDPDLENLAHRLSWVQAARNKSDDLDAEYAAALAELKRDRARAQTARIPAAPRRTNPAK